MSFLVRFLGRSDNREFAEEPRSMQPLLAALSELDADQARYLAAFAYVLSRVAAADRIIDPTEVREMRSALMEEGALPPSQAELVVQLATTEAHQQGASQDYVVTRRLVELTPRAERSRILKCAIRVAAADQVIDGHEEHELRGIARQLGFSDKQFLQTLNEYRDFRSILR